ncbi:MAG: hypothetical protein PUF32_09985 [Prevotella sp.]|nr:hypothetical protein [Prevotella sp.]
MKKQYFKPQTDCVKVNLYGSLLENGGPVAGQSHNPVGKPNPGDVEWSGKGDAFSDDEDENPVGGNSYNIWK